jgi:outer membrane receptor protein involved in Fe transport
MKNGNVLRLLLTLVVVIALVPGLSFAAAGKIRGWVTDSETGEPLMGANIVVQGSTMGAATDVNGEYVILNVPVGKYTLVTSYMGYQKLEISNIIVNEGGSTFRDMKLAKTILQGQQVSIVAEKPLVDKAETNEVHIMRGEDIALMPIRGVAQVITAMAGVIDDGGVHVRGGRANETAYYMDGVNVTKPTDGLDGTAFLSTTVINNAIEEVQMQTGDFSAQYGGKMSGMTRITTKTGGPKYSVTGEVISDDFWAVKNDAGSFQTLGINKLYSYGYNDYVLTASGPMPGYKNLKFFVAGQAYNRLSQTNRFNGFSQDTLTLTNSWFKNDGVTKLDSSMKYFANVPAGRTPGGGQVGYIANGNLVWDIKPFRVKVGGTIQRQESNGESADPRQLLTISKRSDRTIDQNATAYLNFTHTIDPTAFYTLNASYYRDYTVTGDGILWDDWAAYGNPTINPALTDTSLVRDWKLPFDDNFRIPMDNTPGNTWTQRKQEKFGAKIDFIKQFGKQHELAIGGEGEMQTLRWFSFGPRNLALRLAQVAKNPELYTQYDIYKSLFPRMIGYDWLGNQVNEDQIVGTKLGLPSETQINIHNKPMKPMVGGAYIQDRIELRDLIINAGLRFDYFTNGWPSLNNLQALYQGTGGVIREDQWGKEKVYKHLSPRLGFSFPVTDRAQFHATFGKYFQAPDPYTVWGYRGYANFLNFLYGGAYFAPLPNPNLKPEKTTSYEFGFQMAFGSNASLDVTAFYKDTRDLIVAAVLFPTITEYRASTFSTNGDFGTVKGLTATFNLRRSARIQAQMNYTYSMAEGTGSTFGEHFDIAWQENSPVFPKVISSLDYDIRHKGSVIVDFRMLPEDGPELMGTRPLGNIGLNLKFDFNSGSPYTPISIDGALSQVYGYNAPQPLGAPFTANLPWFYQLDAKLDKAFQIGPVRMDVYLWAINLIGTDLFTGGYRQTGRPDTDGWLETTAGKDAIVKRGAYAQDYVRWYQAILTSCGTGSIQTPRQIRLGVKFEL